MYASVSILMLKLLAYTPIACFPIADWYVFLGDYFLTNKLPDYDLEKE